MWNYGDFAVHMGRGDSGLTELRRAVALDPLNAEPHLQLGTGLYLLRQYAEAIPTFGGVEALKPGYAATAMAVTYYMLGDLQNARSSCERESNEDNQQFCLAIVYDRLGRHADAEAMLAKLHARDGDTAALEYVAVYTQWGNTAQALDWLETAMRQRSPDLRLLNDPLFDPIRKEPRFRAIERELKFPT